MKYKTIATVFVTMLMITTVFGSLLNASTGMSADVYSDKINQIDKEHCSLYGNVVIEEISSGDYVDKQLIIVDDGVGFGINHFSNNDDRQDDSNTDETGGVITFASSGTIIYVDDDNIEGPWDGTSEHPYQYVHDGVDAADDGDTVFVFNGVYYEKCIDVYKSIKVVGEDKDNTVIDGNGNSRGLEVSAPVFVLENITIKNCGPNIPDHALVTRVKMENMRIFNCVFRDDADIRFYEDASNVVIESCDIISHCRGIQTIKEVPNFQIINCYISDVGDANWVGFILTGENIKVRDCKFNHCTGVRIYMGSRNIDIYNNTITSGGSGVLIQGSNNAKIYNNTISESSGDGIYIQDSTGVKVYDNIISNNFDGIHMLRSSSNTIYKNEFEGNNRGVYLSDDCENNMFYHNNFRNSIYYHALASSGKDNLWHNADLEQGNYWDDHPRGLKRNKYVWMTPYDLQGNDDAQDEYPLVKPNSDSKSSDLPPKNKQLINLELGIYVENVKKISFPIPIIVGSIDIEVDAKGANRVKFYIDNELKAIDDDTNDNIYTWTWDEFSFGPHTLKVIAYDNADNSDTDEMTVWKFF